MNVSKARLVAERSGLTVQLLSSRLTGSKRSAPPSHESDDDDSYCSKQKNSRISH